ncbi:MAG: NAD(P)H-dependent oxidoreductase [Clostridia bacterium]|nr:NAD(P)H-dependent oxidoreductase [Clostridia bacterium]
MANKLIAYFSATGTTQTVAENLAAASGYDLYEIKPLMPYSKKDLNWMNPLSRSTNEMKGRVPHPAIVTDDIHIAPYDVIFIGFPIWWYIAPTIINSFLEIHDFSGKKIVLFATSGGSGFGKAVKSLQESAPDAEFVEGEVFNGFFSTEQLKEFCEKY